MQDEQPAQVLASRSFLPQSEQASLQSLTEEKSHAVLCNHDSSSVQDTAVGSDASVQAAQGPVTADNEVATAVQCSSPDALRPVSTGKAASNAVDRQDKVSSPGVNSGHLGSEHIRLAVSGRANSMQSSPIYGVASAGSQAFTPMRHSADQRLKQGVYRLEIDSSPQVCAGCTAWYTFPPTAACHVDRKTGPFDRLLQGLFKQQLVQASYKVCLSSCLSCMHLAQADARVNDATAVGVRCIAQPIAQET